MADKDTCPYCDTRDHCESYDWECGKQMREGAEEHRHE